MPYAADGEPKAFYLKLKAVQAAGDAYAAAYDEACKHLLHTHPVRLGLALNYSIFQHEVLEDPEAAIETARSTYEAAKALVSRMPEEAQREAGFSLQLLQDNLLLWEADEACKEAEPSQEETPVEDTEGYDSFPAPVAKV